jgi:hypothetical protein
MEAQFLGGEMSAGVRRSVRIGAMVAKINNPQADQRSAWGFFSSMLGV